MVEEASDKDRKLPSPFVEVKCVSSGMVRRFAAGTKAGFAVYLINSKLKSGSPLALYVEAVKEGEEVVNFGPDAPLTDYGSAWKLQTVSQSQLDHPVPFPFPDPVPDFTKREQGPWPVQMHTPSLTTSFGRSHHKKTIPKSGISFMYMTKIFVAFFLMFVLGGMFVLALESLPQIILFINSFM